MTLRLSLCVLTLTFMSASGCSKSKATLQADAIALNDQGMASMNKGDNDRAIQRFDSALALNPSLAVAWKNRGVARRNRGEHDQAIADIDRAIQLDSTLASAYNSRGFAYDLKGDYERAIKDFDAAVRLNPKAGQAIKSRGRAQFYLGHFDKAFADLQKGLESDSTNPYVVIWLHMAAKRLGMDTTPDLAVQIARTDTLKWPAPVAKLYLGRITTKEFLAAAAAAGDSSTRKHQLCSAAFYLGEYLLWQKKSADATAHFRETKVDCPKDYTEYEAAVAELRRLGDGSK